MNADGSYNRTLLTTDYNGIFWIYEDANENIFVTGGFRQVNYTEQVQFIAKVKPDYNVDLSFKLAISRGAGSMIPVFGIQGTGKLVVGGGFTSLGVPGDSSRLVRLLPDGSVDASFHAAVNNLIVNSGHTAVTAIGVQSDDKLILSGFNLFNSESPALGRLLPNGGFDDTFQTGTGLYNSGFPASVQSILIRDSKIYVLGRFNGYNGSSCRSLVILDETGKMIGPLVAGIPPNSYLQDMAIQSDGKIIIAGDFNIESENRKFIRLNTDGSIDNNFKLKTILGGVEAIEIDQHDNIIVVGDVMDNDVRIIMKRFKPEGAPDPSLDLGSGFTGAQTVVAFFAIPLDTDQVIVGGSFYSYKGVSSPSVILMDNTGSIIPMENHLDSGSVSIRANYANNILYSIGGFTTNFGHVKNGYKITFPIEHQASNYQGKAISDSSMKLSWDGQFEGADKIVIEASSPDASNYSVMATLASNEQSYKLEGLKEVTPYYVRIKGVNDSYASPYLTTSDTTKIIQQEVLPATDVSTNSFVANWKHITATDSTILQLSEDNFVSLVAGYEKVKVNGPSLTVTGLEDGKTYQYHVKRFKNKKASDYSKAVAATTTTIVTALEEENLLSVNVYPNPVADQIIIELKELTSARIVIHSMNGNVLNEYDIAGGSKEIINAQGYPDGIYIMTVALQGKTRTFKLVRSSGK